MSEDELRQELETRLAELNVTLDECENPNVRKLLREQIKALTKQLWLVEQGDISAAAPKYTLVIPEPSPYYSQQDEAAYYHVLKSIRCVEDIRTRTIANPFIEGNYNQVTLTMSEEYLSDEDLRNLIAVMMRYGVPMTALASQCNKRNAKWFKNPKMFWYSAVFEDKNAK
jgi:hypothetical protein